MNKNRIGETLKQKRESMNRSYEYVYSKTRIHPKYLKALEEGDYSIFSSKVHAKGFLKNYANFLGLDCNEILAFWRREFEVDLENKDTSQVPSKNKINLRQFYISPSYFVAAIVLIVFGTLLFSLYTQYNNFTEAPSLVISSPKNNEVLSTDIIDIVGNTEPNVDLYLNNQRISLTSDGSFLYTIKLNIGVNNISVKVTNRLGRTTEKILNIIYRPEESENTIFEVIETTQSTDSSL
jgi:cytoskeletal protein RodZ